jgi:hypothetical protein
VSEQRDGRAAAIALLEEVEALVKDPHMALDFGRQGINTSLAMLGVQGLISYLAGNKLRASEDLATVAEEIRARLDAG